MCSRVVGDASPFSLERGDSEVEIEGRFLDLIEYKAFLIMEGKTHNFDFSWLTHSAIRVFRACAVPGGVVAHFDQLFVRAWLPRSIIVTISVGIMRCYGGIARDKPQGIKSTFSCMRDGYHQTGRTPGPELMVFMSDKIDWIEGRKRNLEYPGNQLASMAILRTKFVPP